MNYVDDTDDADDDDDDMEPQKVDPGDEQYKDPLIGEGSGEEDAGVL